MKRQPLVSVIIPVYNVEAYLEECVISVLNQTYRNLDIILVDDGSKDNSPKICDEYEKKDSRVQVIHKENGGLVSAWRTGMKNVKGEYVVFQDSDDWIDLFMIEDMVNHATGKGKEIVCGNYMIEKENQSIAVRQALAPDVYDRKGIENKIFPYLLGEEDRIIHYSRCMKLISKELILDNMDFCDESLTMGEDAGIMLPAIWDAEYIVVMENACYYHYRFVDSSMAHKYNPRMGEKVELLYGSLKNAIQKKPMEEKQRSNLLANLQKEYIFLFFFVLKNELRGPKEHQVMRIREMVQKAKVEKGLEDIAVAVRKKANMLLYFIWKNPGKLQILVGRTAINVFDKMQ